MVNILYLFFAFLIIVGVVAGTVSQCTTSEQGFASREAEKQAGRAARVAWISSYETFMRNTNRKTVPIEDDAFLRDLEALRPVHLALILDGVELNNYPACRSVSVFRFTLSDGVLLRCNEHYDEFIIPDARMSPSTWPILLQHSQ